VTLNKRKSACFGRIIQREIAKCLRSTGMELALRIQIEELPEGLFLGTSDELPGLVAQGRTVAEALDIARDAARND
jgi:hypothetical protein